MYDSFLWLGIGRLEIDWRKRIIETDHSVLFSEDNLQDVEYFFYSDDGPLSKIDKGYSKPLKEVEERLDLLGHTIPKLKTEYEEYKNSFPAYIKTPKLTFEDLFLGISKININSIEWAEHEGDVDVGEFFTKRILSLKEFSWLDREYSTYPLFFEQLDPYLILRILIENPVNHNLQLQWRHKDSDLDCLEKLTPLDSNSKYLIVTEGPTDSFVIKKALRLLKRDTAVFFDFIDMEKNYPFTGVGSLPNFFKGLLKLGICRKILFIFDNDTAGVRAFREISTMERPDSFKVMTLPELNDFKNFLTVGPTGEGNADINGTAVAIEMFLDLEWNNSSQPRVRWKAFFDDIGQYQGALENKEKYYRDFKCLEDKDLEGYDTSKLRSLLCSIIEKCVE